MDWTYNDKPFNPTPEVIEDYQGFVYELEELSTQFNVFSVKVCMTTTDSTNPPLVKDLRAVALTKP